MVKIRLHGTREEIIKAVEVLKKDFNVLSESEPYKDRGKTEYYRCYLDCEAKEGV